MTTESPEPIEAEAQLISSTDTKLVTYAGEVGLERSATTPLVEAFRPIFLDARRALRDAAGVAESVKDATCVTEIAKARKCRLAIRQVRIAGDKTHKAQKSNALAYGKAVDGFRNILLADLEPVEKALQDAEDVAERMEAARKDALEVTRRAALTPFVPQPEVYQVRDMDDASFDVLLTGVRLAKEATEAATKKAAADAAAAETARVAEVARVTAENARLKAEADAAKAAADRIAAQAAADKLKADAEKAEAARLAQKALDDAAAKAKADAKALKDAADAKAKADKAAQDAKDAAAKVERDAADAKARAEKAEADATALREKALREKAEADLKAARDAEKAKADAAAAQAKAEARKAALAPDKQRIASSIAAVTAAMPTLKDPDLNARVSMWFTTLLDVLKQEHDGL